MDLTRQGDALDRQARINENTNQEKIERSYGAFERELQNTVENVSNEAFDKVVSSAVINWKEPVANVASLPIDDENGTARQVRDTGKVYRFNGTDWIEIQDYDATAINEVDSRLSAQLADKATKESLKQTNNSISKLDATKADKVKTDIKIQNIVSGTPKGSFPTLSALESEYPDGAEGIFIVSKNGHWYYWDGSDWVDGGLYQSQGVADHSITEEKTTFVKIGKNLFDKNRVVEGRLDLTTGEIEEDVDWITSDFLEVLPNTDYKRSHNSIVARYREDYSLVGVYPNNDGVASAGSTTKYFRVSTERVNINDYQLELGVETTYYEEFRKTINDLKVSENELTTEIDKLVRYSPSSGDIIKPVNHSEFQGKTELVSLLNESDPISRSSTFSLFLNQKRKVANKKVGWELTSFSSGTIIFRSSYSPKNLKGVSTICLWVYLPDAEKISSISLGLETVEGSPTKWTRSSLNLDYPLKSGWNLLRWGSFEGDTTIWDKLHGIRLSVVSTEAVVVTVGELYGEKPPKAQILFIEDGGYKEFLENGYPDLVERGIHTTWALNPGRLGEGRVITESDIDMLAESHLNEFSFHSWKSDPTRDMTATELKNDAIKAIRWLQKKGIQPRYWWRAAFTQNQAPHHEVLQNMLDAYASYEAKAQFNVFPFIDRYNVGRLIVHNTSKETMDSRFDILEKTHCLMVCYTHGVREGSEFDATPEEWDYFLQKIDEGLEGGWLESVTYDILRARNEREYGNYGFDNLIDLD